MMTRPCGIWPGVLRLRVAVLTGMLSACGGGTSSETGAVADGLASQGQAAQDGLATRSKRGDKTVMQDRPPGLIYRQAIEQARQRLTADNAHLRLDELDAQIEHEKETH